MGYTVAPTMCDLADWVPVNLVLDQPPFLCGPGKSTIQPRLVEPARIAYLSALESTS